MPYCCVCVLLWFYIAISWSDDNVAGSMESRRYTGVAAKPSLPSTSRFIYLCEWLGALIFTLTGLQDGSCLIRLTFSCYLQVLRTGQIDLSQFGVDPSKCEFTAILNIYSLVCLWSHFQIFNFPWKMCRSCSALSLYFILMKQENLLFNLFLGMRKGREHIERLLLPFLFFLF